MAITVTMFTVRTKALEGEGETGETAEGGGKTGGRRVMVITTDGLKIPQRLSSSVHNCTHQETILNKKTKIFLF
jgi:hypothetical protein